MRLATLVACLVACSVPVAVGQCLDGDGDGYGNPASAACAYAFPPTATMPAVFLSRGALESCDGFDNDCDGQIDNRAECDRTCDPPEGGLRRPARQQWRGDRRREPPGTAWNGSGFATVWSDSRSGRDAVFVAFSDVAASAWAARCPSRPAAATRRPRHRLDRVRLRRGVGPTHGTASFETFFTTLDVSGAKQLLDVALTEDDEISGWPDIAWNGREFGVVWSGESGVLYFTTVDRAGQRAATITTVSTNIALAEPRRDRLDR